MAFRLRLQSELKREGLKLSPAQLGALEKHFDLLSAWQHVHNLTALKDFSDAVGKHYVDCLRGLSVLEPQSKTFDFGSGAGFPGLIGAAVWPDSQFVLVESSRKKCSFLQVAIAGMGLKNVELHQARVETLRDVRFAISRATFSAGLLAHAATALSAGGTLALWGNGRADTTAQELWARSGLKLREERPCHWGTMREREIWLLERS